MFMGANEPTQQQHRNTQREPKKHRPTQTDRKKHTHTHTWETGVQHIGHILVVPIMRDERGTVATHTHRCPRGENKCDCCWLTISMSKVG
jgi:hypothetical protein